MLKTIHRWQKSILVFLFVGILAASMLFFGVDPGNQQGSQHAIKIGDTDISYEQVAAKRRELINYQRANLARFGVELREEDEKRIASQAVDKIIENSLIKKVSKKLGFAVPDSSVKMQIQNSFSENGKFIPERYSQYLRATGRSALAFERSIKEQLSTQNFELLLSDFSNSTKAFALESYRKNETTYSLNYVEINPADKVNEVPKIADNELENYFTENAVDYETKPKVKYSYILLEEKDFREKVQVTDEDIEWYYSENGNKFTENSKADVSHILIGIPEGSSEDDINKLENEAQNILGEALAGKDFAELSKEHSEDVTTKFNGGKIGILNNKSNQSEIFKAADELASEGYTDIVKSSKGFHIVKINKFFPRKLKPLEEVKNQIVNTLKAQEAPSYLSVTASEYKDELEKTKSSLEVFAKSKNYTLATSELVDSTVDVNPKLKGLSKKILEFPEETIKVIELGNNFALVEVLEYKESGIPLFKDVKSQVENNLKKVKAFALAEKSADEMLKKALNSPEKPLKTLFSNSKDIKDIKSTGPFTEIIANEIVKTRVFKTSTPKKLEEVFKFNDKFYLVEVAAVTEPTLDKYEEQKENYLKRANYQIRNTLRNSIIEKLKAKEVIDINAGAL